MQADLFSIHSPASSNHTHVHKPQYLFRHVYTGLDGMERILKPKGLYAYSEWKWTNENLLAGCMSISNLAYQATNFISQMAYFLSRCFWNCRNHFMNVSRRFYFLFPRHKCFAQDSLHYAIYFDCLASGRSLCFLVCGFYLLRSLRHTLPSVNRWRKNILGQHSRSVRNYALERRALRDLYHGHQGSTAMRQWERRLGLTCLIWTQPMPPSTTCKRESCCAIAH